MTTTSDLANDIRKSARDITKDAAQVGHTALEVVNDQIAQPVRELASDAGRYANQAYQTTRESISKHAHQVGDITRENCDRACNWMKENPVTTIGIAFAIGFLFAKSSWASLNRD